MRYKVYCDESRHDGSPNHRYMAIGGLWIPEEREPELVAQFRALRPGQQPQAEVKWNKTRQESVALYSKIVDLFFDFPGAAFRAIVVDKAKVDLARYHQGDQELGFYKFYYEMLEKWILPGHEFVILLDYKQNSDPDRYLTFYKILQARAQKVRARIEDLTVVNSAEEPLVQIADLLTGAISASCCDDLRPGSPKQQLAEHIAKRAGFVSLKNSSLSPAFSKFNIFRIQLGAS